MKTAAIWRFFCRIVDIIKMKSYRREQKYLFLMMIFITDGNDYFRIRKFMPKVAHVYPFMKLPRNIEYFDYYIPADLQSAISIGTIVDIPMKTRLIKGAVAFIDEKTSFESTKEIAGIDKKIGCLLPFQMEFIKWFSSFYYYSPASTLKLILPEIPKRKSSATEKTSYLKFTNITIGKNSRKLAEQVFDSKNKNYLLFPHDLNLKFSFFLALCERAMESKKQILILFPQKFKLEEFNLMLNEKLKKQTVILNNEFYTSKNLYLEMWNKIKNNEKQIILGTRSAVFAPLHSPEFIIVDDAHSEDYKQWDQTPRYRTTTAARKISELTGSKLILSSLTPRIEDAYIAAQEKYQSISLGALKNDFAEIIDLKEERRNEFTYLSDRLLGAIEETMRKKEKALLIVNKKGMFSYFFCKDCAFELKCPHCSLPLIVENESELVCRHCKHSEPIHLRCPSCGGTNMKALGIGLNQIKKILREKFSCAIAEIDENGNASIEAQIILSTGANIRNDVLKNIKLLGLVYVDSLAYLADFNSSWKLFSWISELISRARCGRSLRAIVQTCFTENPAFKYLNDGFPKFYKDAIELRKDFNYPPFRNLIKIFFQHHDLSVCEKEAERIFQLLEPKVKAEKGMIIEPYLYYLKKIRKRYRYQIAIFLPDLPEEREKEIFVDLPQHWSIDREPANLL